MPAGWSLPHSNLPYSLLPIVIVLLQYDYPDVNFIKCTETGSRFLIALLSPVELMAWQPKWQWNSQCDNMTFMLVHCWYVVTRVCRPADYRHLGVRPSVTESTVSMSIQELYYAMYLSHYIMKTNTVEGGGCMSKKIGLWAHNPSLVQMMACRLISIKPLSGPMVPCCPLNPQEQASVKF